MNKKIEQAIGGQINAELYSAYIYLAMAAWLESQNLNGFAQWMKVQAQEEVSHAMKFYHYVYERGGVVEFKAIDKPQVRYKSALDVAQTTLKHEQEVTQLIYGLYELGNKEKDHMFTSFLKWFIDEQVEEEANAEMLIKKIELAGEKGPGLYILDKELGERKED